MSENRSAPWDWARPEERSYGAFERAGLAKAAVRKLARKKAVAG